MDLKKTSIFCLIAFFPIFALKSNLPLVEIILVISIFFIATLVLNYFLIKKILNNYI